jgi:hypothetical protein
MCLAGRKLGRLNTTVTGASTTMSLAMRTVTNRLNSPKRSSVTAWYDQHQDMDDARWVAFKKAA